MTLTTFPGRLLPSLPHWVHPQSVGWETIKGIQSSVLVLCTFVHFTNFECICLVVNIIQKDLSKFPSVQSPIAAICLHIIA